MGKRERLSAGERLYRVRRISLTFGRIYLGIKTHRFIERRLGPPDMKRRWSRFHQQSANAIYAAAVELHGFILKGCQFIGSRADVAPPEYVEILSRLQDRVPPKPFEIVRKLVESELGGPLDSLFESFSERPIASASLAQVHEARLHGGERVAVKVQYPDIASLVRSDLANLRALFRAVGFIERDFDLMPLINELGEHVPRELDFINEGRNSETIAEFFEGRDDIYIPRIYWQYTTPRVLVMELVDGIKISDREALRAAGVDSNAIMRTLIEAYCEQILSRGFFHADPHPGNLMVLPSPSETAPARLVMVDFGLAKQLPPAFRETALHFAAALLQGEPEAMARALVELGFETRDNPVESLRTISAILLDVARQLRNQSFVDPEVVRYAAEELPRLIRENPIVQVPSHVVLLARVFALLSGLGSTLGARIDMLRIILPYALDASPEQTDAPPDDSHPLGLDTR